MSDYKLTVTRTRPNEHYDQQMAEAAKPRYWNETAPPCPDRYVVEQTLEVALTEAEFLVIKKAVLATFGPRDVA